MSGVKKLETGVAGGLQPLLPFEEVGKRTVVEEHREAPVPTIPAEKRPAEKSGGVQDARMIGHTSGDPDPVHTKPFDLAKAIADPNFVAMDPAKLEVPQALLDAIKTSKRIVIFGHKKPDPDCVGSALAIARALKAMDPTVEVDVCMSDKLNAEARMIDSHGEVVKPGTLANKSWDLALIVDTPDRIGEDALALLPKCGKVAVFDHHPVEPTAEALGVPKDNFIPWWRPDFPASGLAAGALIGKWRPQLDSLGVDLAELYRPALAGFATDTSWGLRPGVDEDWYRYFKHMIGSAGLSLEQLEKQTKFVAPLALVGAVAKKASPLIDEVVHAPIEEGLPKVRILTVDAKQNDALLAIGNQGVANGGQRVEGDDLAYLLQARLDKTVVPGQPASLSVLLQEYEGAVRLSTRSTREGDAGELADRLGGGGHATFGGGVLEGRTIEQIVGEIEAWAREKGLIAPQ